MNTNDLTMRQLYKFTGPPENWITAIKFMTWGLEAKYRKQWAAILPGDIFLMHSTSTNTKVKDAKSAIIGFGVVGNNPTIKNVSLWIQELENSENKWPLLVPFSEIYLFSDFFESSIVPEPKLANVSEVASAARAMLEGAVPLSEVNGFPQMGSMASVRPAVVEQIFRKAPRMYVIGQGQEVSDYTPTPFIKLDDLRNQTRYATSLQTLDEVKSKSFNAKGSTFTKDPVLLERAEQAHKETLERLMGLFKNAGYETYFNRHVDLFAIKDNKSFLFEVKSNENTNFRPQARKGVVQLFEYEYFEIKKFQQENNIQATTFKNLTFSSEPNDKTYTEFMNSLELGVSFFHDNQLKAVGKEIGIGAL